MNELLLSNIVAGLRAGGHEAIEKARQTHTKLVVWRDGITVEMSPEEVDAMLALQEKKIKEEGA